MATVPTMDVAHDARAAAAEARLRNYLRWHHPHVPFEDLEPTCTRGYWQRKTVCPGNCAPLSHHAPMQHTISFFDPWREHGRFTSPYRTWAALRDVRLK